jgi:Flp pilus assembly protein TadD
METRRYPLLAGACAAFLVAGCAQTGSQSGAQASRVEPVYRVSQPVGTAAGQYAVGRIDLGEGRYEVAIGRFRAALQLDPTFVEAHNGLGVAYGQTGRFAEAAEAFRAALASGPAQAHVLNNLGFAQLKAGRLDEAWVSLRRSYDLEPANPKTRENLVLLAEARRLAAAQAMAAPLAAAESAEQEAAPIVASRPAGNEAAPIVASTPAMIEPAPVAAAEPVAASEPVAHAPLARAAVDEPAAAPIEPAPPAAALVAVAQAKAARLLGEAANPAAYEVVVSRSSEAELVQLSPGVYELRSKAVAIAAPAALPVSQGPVAASRVAVAPVRPYRVEARVATLPDVPAVRPAAFSPQAEGRVLALPPRQSLKQVAGLEVSNAVGLRSLAGRTARQLERFGASVARVSDFRVFGKGRTEVHYLPGHLESAKAVQQRLPVDAALVKVSNMHPGVNVRLVVGRDMVVGPIAWWGDDLEAADSVTMARAAQVAPPSIGIAPAPADSLVIAAPPGVDLTPFAAKVARVDVEDGWRHL